MHWQRTKNRKKVAALIAAIPADESIIRQTEKGVLLQSGDRGYKETYLRADRTPFLQVQVTNNHSFGGVFLPT